MLQHLEGSTRVADLRGVAVAAAAYAALGGVMRVHRDAAGAFPLGLMLVVYALAAGGFARRGGPGWMRDTARDSLLALWAGAAWIAVEASVVDAVQDALLPPPSHRGMDFSIAEGPCFGPPPAEVALFLALASGTLAAGSILAGWAARRLLRMQQEAGDG